MKGNFLRLLLLVVTAFSSCNKKSSCKAPEEVSYVKDIAPVIEQKCFMCHAPDVYKKKASRVRIYDYNNLVSIAKGGRLLGAIKHEPGYIAMPYRKNEKIDECAILLIEKWVESGLKK